MAAPTRLTPAAVQMLAALPDEDIVAMINFMCFAARGHPNMRVPSMSRLLTSRQYRHYKALKAEAAAERAIRAAAQMKTSRRSHRGKRESSPTP